MRGSLLVSLSLVVALAGACTPAAPPATPTPPAPTAPTTAGSSEPAVVPAAPVDPMATPANLRTEGLPTPPADVAPPALPAARKDVPGPAKECQAWATRRAAKAPVCKTREEAMTALDAAMAEGDAGKRDAMLAGLEVCAGLPAGIVRALRADLAPNECADVVAEPGLKTAGVGNVVAQVMTAEVLSGRLARLGGGVPVMKPPYDRQHVLEHIKGPVAKWLVAQTNAIEEASQIGAKLGAYARGLVAIEAALADLRLVESVRAVPAPAEWDQELKSVYYAALDEVLEPRKVRGRDAALVGLGELASMGVLADARLDRVRDLLSRLYRGRRINALDGLLLPPLAATAARTPEERLAGRLPTFFATQLLDPSKHTDAVALRMWLERGLAPAVRIGVRDQADATTEQRRLLAQGRISLGQRYWRAVDFDEAVRLASKGERDDALTLLLALGLSLRAGPENAAALMLRPPSTSLGVDVAALDKVASSGSPLAPLAAYDAALLLSLSPPDSADEAYWRKVAQRFQDASGKLGDAKQKERAAQDARQATEIADALKNR